MHPIRLILPVTALGALAIVVGSDVSRGWSVTGDFLDLNQRDVRVFDNFTAPTANDNTTSDPDWPGYTGLELAIWKAASEWGSAPHGGTGAGDPTQAVVGSGDSNFDFTWQGNATQVGGFDDNIVSQISGSSGGMLAFVDFGTTSDGWRLRFYENYDWQDGPDDAGVGYDIQGVATNLFGFVLGLGPSNVQGATMNAVLAGTGASKRSIEADDIAGLQFIYGVKSPSKPVIAGVAVANGLVVITGQNFSPSGNEVWFTQLAQGGTGEPVKVTGLLSDGSSIVLAIPAAAGPGDVLVRNLAPLHFGLSNAWPFALDGPPPPCSVSTYCVAKLSSNFCVPQIGSSGTPSLSSPLAFTVVTTEMEQNAIAIDFFGTNGHAAIPFQGGTLCCASPIYRMGGKFSGGASACTGSISYTLQEVIDNTAGGPLVAAGTPFFIQTWGRDTGDPSGSSLSNALQVVTCP